MRHSKLELTMGVYTDPKFLDVHGALDVLPQLPLAGPAGAESVLMTGTDPRTVAPTVAPTWCNRGQDESFPVKLGEVLEALAQRDTVAVTSIPVNTKDPLTTAVSESSSVGATGLEPVTPSVSSNRNPDATLENKGLAATLPGRCTYRCTNASETDLVALAAVLLNLSPEDRTRLAALLRAQTPGAGDNR
jgi:hypothetical protein